MVHILKWKFQDVTSGLSMNPPGWEWVGKGVDSPENLTAQEGALGGFGLTPPLKPQWVHYKLEEANEKPCSDVLVHNPVVCKGILSNQWMPGYQG
jgi:hypothetical protein